MRIYLAHNFCTRKWLNDYIVPFLTNELGHVVTSKWVTQSNEIALDSNLTRDKEAAMDLEDLEVAEAIILFTDQIGESPGRGKYLELGYAIRAGKRVYLCGSRESFDKCVFYHLPSIVKIEVKDNITDPIKMGEALRNGLQMSYSTYKWWGKKVPEGASIPMGSSVPVDSSINDKYRFKSGATSTKQPRLSLIPPLGLVNLAERFELGVIKHPEGCYNALTNQSPLQDKEWLIERLSHAIKHCYDLIGFLSRDEGGLEVAKGDAGAIAFCGVVLGEALCRDGGKGELTKPLNHSPTYMSSFDKCVSEDDISSSLPGYTFNGKEQGHVPTYIGLHDVVCKCGWKYFDTATRSVEFLVGRFNRHVSVLTGC